MRTCTIRSLIKRAAFASVRRLGVWDSLGSLFSGSFICIILMSNEASDDLTRRRFRFTDGEQQHLLEFYIFT